MSENNNEKNKITNYLVKSPSSTTTTTTTKKPIARTDTIVLDENCNSNTPSTPPRNPSDLTQPFTPPQDDNDEDNNNNNNNNIKSNGSISKKRSNNEISSTSDNNPDLKRSKNSNNSSSSSNNNNNNNNFSIEDYEIIPEESQSSTIFLIPYDGEKYKDVWSSDYVKLPCSKNNVYRSINSSTSQQNLELGESALQQQPQAVYLSKWYLINTVLIGKIKDSEELEEAIKSMNPRCNWNFQGLHDYFETECSEMETKEFFEKTLPFIIKLALSLPKLCPKPIPLLGKSVDREIILSQKQVASLLANAFLCTFPRQGNTNNNRYSSKYPSINFHSLYEAPCIPSKAAKLKCIIHYFKKISEKMPQGNISFHRQVFGDSDFPDWEKSDSILRDITTFSNGTIEDNGVGMLQVDFANKMIGGGVLGYGCVQEEIRFVINPELLVSRLFTAQFQDNETMIIIGSERFSKYSGYGDTFQWAGTFNDVTPTDHLGRKLTSILVMDALKNSGDPFTQFSPHNIERELNKAFCGFSDKVSVTLPPPIATGNWGCGVFGGDKFLKSLIQLMASSQTNRDMVYYSFGDDKFANELTFMVSFLQSKFVTVGDLYKALWEYYKLMSFSKSNLSLYSYLDAHFN
eukprot:gene1124-1429_t